MSFVAIKSIIQKGWVASVKVIPPLRWRVWDQPLRTHTDQRFREYIVRGLQEGFRVGCTKATADSLECSEGRVVWPLNPALFPGVQTNRFGVIPKGTTGKWWLIVDMSFLEGSLVNDEVSETLCSLTYIGVKDAVKAIVMRGRGTLMAKVDIKSAYRILCTPRIDG